MRVRSTTLSPATHDPAVRATRHVAERSEAAMAQGERGAMALMRVGGARASGLVDSAARMAKVYRLPERELWRELGEWK
jgi:hypothetical protein